MMQLQNYGVIGGDGGHFWKFENFDILKDSKVWLPPKNLNSYPLEIMFLNYIDRLTRVQENDAVISVKKRSMVELPKTNCKKCTLQHWSALKFLFDQVWANL